MAKMESGVKGIYRLEDKPNNKCRKWKIVLSLGRDAATGKYRQTSRNFTGTFTQAKAEKRILQGQAEEGKIVKRSSYTFRQYAEHWMEVRTTSGKIAPTTLRRDRNKLKAVYHLIGQARLQDITSQELESAYARLLAGESISGKPLSGTYVRDIGKKISVMFDHAVKTGVLPANPCKSAEAPKQDTQERRAMPEDLFHGLVGRLDPHDSMQFAVLAITQLGLRRSEVTGISREDIDFEAHVISVRNDYPDTGDLKEAKTTAGRRSLPMSDFLESAIRQRILAMLFDFERFAPHLIVRDAKGRPADIVGEAPLVCSAAGRRTRAGSLGSWWCKSRDGLGVPGWQLHEIRHTFVTIGALHGVSPKVMQMLAGHASFEVTMDIYTHIGIDAKREAMDAMPLVGSDTMKAMLSSGRGSVADLSLAS